MFVVPAATGVTVPVVVVVLIVATAVFEDDQALLDAAVPDPVSAVVAPTQTLAVPDIVGNGLTVIATELLDAERQPFTASQDILT